MGGTGATPGRAVGRARTRAACDDMTPLVSHVVEARHADTSAAVAAVALEAVARQLRPAAATFFVADADGTLTRSIVHRAGSPACAVATVTTWVRALRDADPLAPPALAGVRRGVATVDDVGGLAAVVADNPRLGAAYRAIGVVNDARLLVRRDDRIVAGVTLWRRLGDPSWTPAQLELLETLQPLVEQAYLEARRADGFGDRLPAALTDREREVALLVADGATNAEIARALQIGVETVKSHTRAILVKLGARSRRDVAALLREPHPMPLPADDAAAGARLVCALLRWSHRRLDGAAGGYAVLSGRGSVVHGEALCALAERADDGLPVERARELHEALCAPAFIRRAVTDGASWDVGAADASHPRAGRLAALAAEAGWSRPLVLVLRARGRAAGLLWLARAAASAGPEREAVAELRAMRPLVEAATGPLLLRALARSPLPSGLERAALTAREWEVARACVAGATNAQIAEALGIAPGTVKAYVSQVLMKCGVRSRTELIARMRRR
jgi:DNA-binding NarL/FixJ family response regulator